MHVYSGRDLPWQLEVRNWRADGELGADGEGQLGLSAVTRELAQGGEVSWLRRTRSEHGLLQAESGKQTEMGRVQWRRQDPRWERSHLKYRQSMGLRVEKKPSGHHPGTCGNAHSGPTPDPEDQCVRGILLQAPNPTQWCRPPAGLGAGDF